MIPDLVEHWINSHLKPNAFLHAISCNVIDKDLDKEITFLNIRATFLNKRRE